MPVKMVQRHRGGLVEVHSEDEGGLRVGSTLGRILLADVDRGSDTNAPDMKCLTVRFHNLCMHLA